MRLPTSFCLAAIAAGAAVGLPAKAATVTLSSVGPTTYSQDFDTLATSGTTNPLTDITALGWDVHSPVVLTTYVAANGGAISGSPFRSFGATSNAERALGSWFPNNGIAYVQYGFSIAIDSDSTDLQSLTLSYVGEQWQKSGSAILQSLAFAYSLNASSVSTGTWISVPALNFTSLHATPNSGALNGNDPANQTSLSHTFESLNLTAGSTVFFRWRHTNLDASDHGLAIDTLRVSATFAASEVITPHPAVPTPAAAIGGFSLLTGLVAARTAQRRRLPLA